MRSILKSILTIALGSLLVFTFIGCEGDEGPAGPAGRDGVNEPHAPIITGVLATPDSLGSGEYTVLYVDAYDPNGDDMTYSWSATAGELSSTDQSIVAWTAPSDLGLYQITVTVSDVDGSADASVTVGVNVYVPSVFPSYGANDCGRCHSSHWNGWSASNHANAYESVAGTNNFYCIQCHTTGFDDKYNHSGELIETGEDRGGYDENPIEALAAVTCEACHGPMGPNLTVHNADLINPLRGQSCAKCHSQWDEYKTSGHGTVIDNIGYDGEGGFTSQYYTNSPGCYGCHTNEGFLIRFDSDWSVYPAEPWEVTCATCHDLHMAQSEDNHSYLRGLEAVTLEYSAIEGEEEFVIDNWGDGQLCIQCHHAKRTIDDIEGQLNNGSNHPGPHSSPQADMVAGTGCWEIEGYEYERDSEHHPGRPGLENMCVKCHMEPTPDNPDTPGFDPYHGHSFAADVRACQDCHEGLIDFNYENRRTEIADLMDELLALLPNDGEEPLFDTESTTYEQREAAYGWYFVRNEGSMGVHNYPYAKAILENAIDYMNSENN